MCRAGWSITLACLLAIGGCAAEPEPYVATETAASTEGVWFTDVARTAGLGDFRHETGAEGQKLFPESMGSGASFIDYDGDGWLDVLLAGGGTWPGGSKPPVPALWLYRNQGDGTFSLHTEEAGLAGVEAYTLGFAVADYDNDGDQDVYLTTLTENMLFRNEAGTFTEVGQAAGVAGTPVWSSSALFFDADRDGWLDLYVGNYVDWSPETDIRCTLDGEQKDYCTPQVYTGVIGRFYHNNGAPGSSPGQAPTFTDRTEPAGFQQAHGKALGVLEFDFNRDGWSDIVVANDTDPDELFVNNGDPGSGPGQAPTFTEEGVTSGIAYDEKGRTRAGMGIDAGVVDSTGEETVFIGHFSREMIGVYRHLGDGIFTDRAAASKIGRPSLRTLTFGLFLFDVDLDGDLDLFAANGHVQPTIQKLLEGVGYAEPAHLFINQGDGTFEDAAPTARGALQDSLVARGAAFGDYDRDGDVDVLITENAGGVRLWRNERNSDAFLRVHLEGRESNRDALGARVVAYAGSHPMERMIRSGSSYLSASEHVATFGLGAHAQADSLIVYWPSGRVDRFSNLTKGQDVRIVEGTGAWTPRYAAEVTSFSSR